MAAANVRPMPGPYTDCGELLPRPNATPIFLPDGPRSPLPLTMVDAFGNQNSIAGLLLSIVPKNDHRRTCIHGIVYYNRDGAPQLIPLSLNREREQLNIRPPARP